MKATELDYDTECTACNGTGESYDEDRRDSCPHCGGDGMMNRYQDGDDGHVVLMVEYEKDGPLIKHRREQMPITDEERGGFEGRYGSWQPSDVTTGPMGDYKNDTLDRLDNNGLSGSYQMPDEPPYNSTSYDASDMPEGAYPSDASCCSSDDPCLDHVIAWLKARGDDVTASRFEKIKQEKQ